MADDISPHPKILVVGFKKYLKQGGCDVLKFANWFEGVEKHLERWHFKVKTISYKNDVCGTPFFIKYDSDVHDHDDLKKLDYKEEIIFDEYDFCHIIFIWYGL